MTRQNDNVIIHPFPNGERDALALPGSALPASGGRTKDYINLAHPKMITLPFAIGVATGDTLSFP
ncbi:hypothetical protein CBM2633_A70224 [Cupriavidus taiwanensis]|nr:hypothetical protein CBM2633_A70224 [Cupriavidus taiwanensis]